MHACHAARESICMHACMSWPAVSKELLAATYTRVAPQCQRGSAASAPTCEARIAQICNSGPEINTPASERVANSWLPDLESTVTDF